MLADAAIAPIAALLADPTRVAILLALSDGREVAAGDLALAASVSAPTASVHLARLVAAGLLGTRADGRHRFYRLLRPELIHAMEALAVLAPAAPPRTHGQARIGRTVRTARTCYDHLAGRLGVAVTGALIERGLLTPPAAGRRAGGAGPVSTFELTAAGERELGALGIDLAAARARRRAFAPACLDWSERVPHVAGALGAALLAHHFAHGWIERLPASRAVQITQAGREGFHHTFGLTAASL